MKRQDKRRHEGSLWRKQLKERQSHSLIHVTDSVMGGKMIKKKGAQTEGGSAGCCQMKTATTSNQPITVR